jgi:hypothetical protein
MDKDLKTIYLSSLYENYNQQYYYLIYEMTKINNYIDINEEIEDIKKDNNNIINNIEIIKNKIKQYNILK